MTNSQNIYTNRNRRTLMTSKSYLAPRALLLLLASALIIVGCEGEDEDLISLPAVEASAAPEVSFGEAAISREALHGPIEGSGTVQPSRQVMLTAPYPARITNVDVTEGDFVERGTRVVQLDTTVQRQQAAQANASAAAQRAQAQQAAAEITRLTPLLEYGVVTEQQIDQLGAQRVALEESVTAAEAMVTLSRAQQYDGSIKAPFDGVITDVPAEIGAMAMPGVPVVRLLDMSAVDIHVSLSEADIASVEIGDSVQVRVPATGIEREGSVRFVNPEIDQMTRFGTIIVRVDNSDGALMAGSFVRIKTDRRDAAQVLVVPSDALLRTSSGVYVFVITGSSEERRPVTVDRLPDGRWALLDGVSGNEQLRTGDLVHLASNASARTSSED